MAYKQPSSGLPFKEMGSSPAKQHDDLHKAEAHSTSVKKPIETHVDHSTEWKTKDDYVKEFFKKEGETGMTKGLKQGFGKFLRTMEPLKPDSGKWKRKMESLVSEKENGELKKKFIGPKNKITQKKSTDFDPETMGTN